ERFDDVRMIELSGVADLAMKTANRVLVGHALLAHDLDGNDLAEFPVSSLENSARTSFAQPFEQDVGAEEQFLNFALEELIDLVGRKQALLDQCLANGARTAALAAKLRDQRVQVALFQQVELAKGLDQVVERGDGHACSLLGGPASLACSALPVSEPIPRTYIRQVHDFPTGQEGHARKNRGTLML